MTFQINIQVEEDHCEDEITDTVEFHNFETLLHNLENQGVIWEWSMRTG